MTAVIPPSRSGARASLLWVLCPEEFETASHTKQDSKGQPGALPQSARHSLEKGAALSPRKP